MDWSPIYSPIESDMAMGEGDVTYQQFDNTIDHRFHRLLGSPSILTNKGSTDLGNPSQEIEFPSEVERPLEQISFLQVRHYPATESRQAIGFELTTRAGRVDGNASSYDRIGHFNQAPCST